MTEDNRLINSNVPATELRGLRLWLAQQLTFTKAVRAIHMPSDAKSMATSVVEDSGNIIYQLHSLIGDVGSGSNQRSDDQIMNSYQNQFRTDINDLGYYLGFTVEG